MRVPTKEKGGCLTRSLEALPPPTSLLARCGVISCELCANGSLFDLLHGCAGHTNVTQNVGEFFRRKNKSQ